MLGEAVHRIDHRTAEMARRLESMEARMTTLLGAFETGGLRGFRQAARVVRGG